MTGLIDMAFSEGLSAFPLPDGPEMAGWNAWPLTVIEDLVISRGGRKLTLDEMAATILGHTPLPE
jgi:hypothetical protein